MPKAKTKRTRHRPNAMLIEMDGDVRGMLHALMKQREAVIGEPTSLAATVRALIRYGAEKKIWDSGSTGLDVD